MYKPRYNFKSKVTHLISIINDPKITSASKIKGYYITDTINDAGLYYLSSNGKIYDSIQLNIENSFYWPTASDAITFWEEWKKKQPKNLKW